MTNHQNRKRWAIKQKDLARANFVAEQPSRDAAKSQTNLTQEFYNMFFGADWSHWIAANAP